MADPEPSSPELGPGVPAVLKNYRLVRRLGSGGMGAVFEAVDRRDESRVALKLLHAHLAGDESFRERFEREAHVAALLRSPYTVHLLDYGIAEGHYFLVMEYVDGESVAQRITAEGRLDPRRALAITADAARALEEANARGVVHRDIKPDNILLGSNGSVKVADFGVARRVGSGGDLNAAAGFIGTTAYAAPEQSTDNVDSRADIYALGASLYCMLTGQPPFHGAGADILRQHQEAPVPMGPLAGLPDQVVNIVRRCMEKEREDRYENASDLVGALERAARSLTNQGARTSTAPGAGDATVIAPSAPVPSLGPIPETQVGTPSNVTLVAPTPGASSAAESVAPSNSQPEDMTFVSTGASPALPVEAALSAAPADGGASLDGASEPPSTARPSASPPGGGQRGRGKLFAIAGIAAVIVAGAAIAFFALGGGGGGEDSAADDDTPSSRDETRTVRTTTARAVLTRDARTESATTSTNNTVAIGVSPGASATATRTVTVAATATRPASTVAPATATTRPAATPTVARGRIVSGEWTYNFITISNSCGSGATVGESFDNTFTLDDANGDGYLLDGEEVTITDGQNGNEIGTYTFTYPSFTFQAALEEGDFVVVRNQYSSERSGTSLREDHYTVNGRPCVIAFQDG